MPTERLATAPPKGFLRACVLLLLRERPTHGYDLIERLEAFGFDRSDPGGLYRTLRTLEDDRLVHSSWERSLAGPDRRTYEITRTGMERLHDQAKGLVETADGIERFISRYEEFVALPRARADKRPAGDGQLTDRLLERRSG